MDDLGWDVEDSFLISNSNSSSIYGDHHIFIDPTQQLQKSHPSDHVNPVSNMGVSAMVDSQPVPASDFDMLWCSSPLLNSSAASVSDIGQAIHSQVLINGGATSSLESIDCLLSATNSNTDNTSVEDDDGISMIFSDCKNLWNFVATSSGESENNNGSNTGHDTVSPKSGSSKRSINGEFKVDRGYLADSSAAFKLVHENPPKAKKARSEKSVPSSSNINFQQPSSSSVSSSIDEPDPEAIAQMKEMIYRAAAFRPVNLGTEAVERPKRKNVRISTDPQTVAARQRRERISERIRVLQKLVPGGNKMDTASMLDEAANYLKFLRSQVKALENLGYPMTPFTSFPLNQSFPMQTHNFLLLNRNPVHHP